MKRNKITKYKIKKEGSKRKVDHIKPVRSPPKLLKNLAASILRLGTLTKRRKISEIEKINRYY